MMSNVATNGTTITPPGPSEKFDLHISPDSFAKVGQLIDQYGDISRVSAISRNSDSFLINHPDYIKQVLLANHENYIKGVGFERVKLLLGNGIIVSDGPFWRRQRRMIQPAFHKSNIEKLSASMLQSNLDLLASWEQIADSGAAFNLTRTVSELSLEIILQAIFSRDLATLIETHGENPFAFFTDDTVRDLRVAYKFRQLTKMLSELIEARRRHDRHDHDLLSAFMNARDKESNEPMTTNEVIDEVKTMIVAGHETSAGTLNWVWYLLSQHPQVEEKLHAEVDRVLKGRMPSFDDIANLSYTRKVIEETLRLYPPVWLYTRKAKQADQIGKYQIPGGADIFISPYYLHRNEQFWDKPDEFNPERFDPEAVKARHRFAYIPFSAGPRRCIGDIFGIIEMQLHLGVMAQKFRLRYVEDKPIKLDPAINLRSKHSLMMTIERRCV